MHKGWMLTICMVLVCTKDGPGWMITILCGIAMHKGYDHYFVGCCNAQRMESNGRSLFCVVLLCTKDKGWMITILYGVTMYEGWIIILLGRVAMQSLSTMSVYEMLPMPRTKACFFRQKNSFVTNFLWQAFGSVASGLLSLLVCL